MAGALQTTIQEEQERAYAGQLADTGYKYARSYCLETAASAGQPVVRGATDKQARAVVNADTIDDTSFLGFMLHSPTRAFESSGGSPVPANETISALQTGSIFLELTGPAAAGEAVLVGNTTATLGQIQGTSGAGLVAAPRARFEESGVSGDFVTVRVER